MASPAWTCFAQVFVVTLLFTGSLLLGAAVLAPEFIRDALRVGILEQVVLKPNSPDAVYNRFTRNDLPGAAPDVLNFYVWNITNLDDVRAGERPRLQQLGPYRYRKWRVKHDVQFNREGLVSFADVNWVTEDHDEDNDEVDADGGAGPDSEQGKRWSAEDDVVVTLNLPLMGVLRMVEFETNGATKGLLEVALHEFFGDRGRREGLFMRRTVRELLFGYHDELLTAVARWVPSLADKAFFRLVENSSDVDAALARPRNLIDTGLLDASRVWDMKRWKGFDKVSCWNDHSVEVHGSDALQFPPGLTANDSVTVFVGELFRTAKLNVTGETSVHGIRLLAYIPDSNQAEPDPRFFTEISGLMNVTACAAVGPDGDPASRAGPDVFMSLPHFCGVDPAVAAQTLGTECDLEKHVLWIGVEPNTGITMAAAKRLQVSSSFDSRYRAFDPDLLDTILPIFWAEELATISPDNAAAFRAGVYAAQNALSTLESIWLKVAGVALLLLALAASIVLCHRSKKRSRRSRNGVETLDEDAACTDQLASNALTQPASIEEPLINQSTDGDAGGVYVSDAIQVTDGGEFLV